MRDELRAAVVAVAVVGALGGEARAADHADTPNLVAVARHDGRITDLHAFTVGDNLVLSLSTNPNIAVGVTSYAFPADAKFRFHIDKKAKVNFDDPVANTTYGGAIEKPHRVESDITIEITFPGGVPTANVEGANICGLELYSGLRDDPFIRGPRQGRNIGAIVVQFPLSEIINHHGRNRTLLIWATSDVPNINGMIEEHGGRALRSQFAPNDPMNNLPPAEHFNILGLVPDVIIFDTSRPAAFPNGRALTDDVVDLVADPGTLASDAPFPSGNDKPFLGSFPYLAEPW